MELQYTFIRGTPASNSQEIVQVLMEESLLNMNYLTSQNTNKYFITHYCPIIISERGGGGGGGGCVGHLSSIETFVRVYHVCFFVFFLSWTSWSVEFLVVLMDSS